MAVRLTPASAAWGFFPPGWPVSRCFFGPFSGRRGRREAEADAGSGFAAGGAVVDHPDAPAVGLDDRARDRQAEPGAAIRARRAVGALLEGIEDPLTIGGGDPGAC